VISLKKVRDLIKSLNCFSEKMKLTSQNSHSSLFRLLSLLFTTTLHFDVRASQRLNITRGKLRAFLLLFFIFQVLSCTYRRKMSSDIEKNRTLTEFVSEEQFNETIRTFLNKRHEKEKPLWTRNVWAQIYIVKDLNI